MVIVVFRPLLATRPAAAASKVPATLTHNGRIFANSAPIDGTVNLVFSLVDQGTIDPDTSLPKVLWSERHDGIACLDGYFSVLLGADAGSPLHVEDLLGALDLELTITVSDVTNGDIPLSPGLKVTSMPFALTQRRRHRAGRSDSRGPGCARHGGQRLAR
jgi:hypothetical protein